MSKSRTNNRHAVPFPHPGETLREDYLKPLAMRTSQLATQLRVPATRLSAIVNGRGRVDADIALRLARYFNTTAKFWLNLQISYDLATAADTKLEKITSAVRQRE
jgi:addiction module HigA family antidote